MVHHMLDQGNVIEDRKENKTSRNKGKLKEKIEETVEGDGAVTLEAGGKN